MIYPVRWYNKATKHIRRQSLDELELKIGSKCERLPGNIIKERHKKKTYVTRDVTRFANKYDNTTPHSLRKQPHLVGNTSHERKSPIHIHMGKIREKGNKCWVFFIAGKLF